MNEQDPYESEEYQKFVERMAERCLSYPVSSRPCEGCLQGSVCDELKSAELEISDMRDEDFD